MLTGTRTYPKTGITLLEFAVAPAQRQRSAGAVSR
jgi:hypothetical protein